jgi:hypothetical protein
MLKMHLIPTDTWRLAAKASLKKYELIVAPASGRLERSSAGFQPARKCSAGFRPARTLINEKTGKMPALRRRRLVEIRVWERAATLAINGVDC